MSPLGPTRSDSTARVFTHDLELQLVYVEVTSYLEIRNLEDNIDREHSKHAAEPRFVVRSLLVEKLADLDGAVNGHGVTAHKLEHRLPIVGFEHVEADHLLVDVYARSRAPLDVLAGAGHDGGVARRLDAAT